MNLRYFPLVVLCLSLVACSKDKPTADDGTKPGVTTDTETNPLVVPASLKSAAFDYKGLEDPKMLTYTAQFNEEMSPEDGTETIMIKEVSDDRVVYNVERTGSLNLLGTDTLELNAAGVSMTASSQGVLDKPSLELPADIHVGSEWSNTSNMEMGTKKFSAVSSYKVVREESLSVEAGTFDCLVIESKMQATISGSTVEAENGKATTTLTAYYAKGVGMVKMVASTVKPDKSKQNFNIVLKKIG